MHFKVNSVFSPAVLWVLLAASTLASSIAALEAGARCIRELHSLRGVADPSHIAQNSVWSRLRFQPTSQDGHGLTTIAARPFDELARFSAHVAHEQGIDLVQLQSESVNTAPARLSQVRVRLRVRGDYAGTKMFLASLLTNFPGLTLEHLTIRHNSSVGPGGESTPTATEGDDDSAIELIQYSTPAQGGA